MLQGLSLLGAGLGQPNPEPFRAVAPATGLDLDPPFHPASGPEVDRAVAAANAAAPALRAVGGAGRGRLLRALAAGLEQAAGELLARFQAETALPEARARGELARTCHQLRLFAEVAEEGSWVEARLDAGDPDRTPAPRPELRSMLEPLGPVAVFGASNFPLAFGVLGGDTASALAAGCPVVAKAHPLNPGVSELGARVAQAVLEREGLDPGTLTLLFDGGFNVAERLVRHPGIRAVGFTGSLAGGRALLELAAGRAEPIPVYAEMGSVNPVVVLPAALAARGAAIARALAGSVLQSLGQLCTCPGLLVAVQGPGLPAFRAGLAEGLSAAEPGRMLGARLARGYREACGRWARAGAAPVFEPRESDPGQASAALLEVPASRLLADPTLCEEAFGPAALLVVCADEGERRAVLAALPGQLTASLWLDPDDTALAASLLPRLGAKAGRLVFNGVPTGVEVGHAMVHGGPWPATSAAQSTSVGTRAITRWARPVCYQDAPEGLLPAELRQANPLGLWRQWDGQLGRR